MTYRVLARKWRPNSLDDLIGQPALVQTLTASLTRQQLHHAYLFTGTRGVGKTSVARILAKCLNCEQGVTATPCLKCSSCVAINEGRFADLIEVDAASRTRVEETRDLLDNVPYAPTQGRFKVYLIDEVHMLSGHSFNALLKTLEEPPEHVKFFLATTDPQRLPVTILSRCLQFHLKALSTDALKGHLAHVCTQEGVTAEPAALQALSQSAKGSVRDALSLLEQSIAYGQGKVTSESVRHMLGASSADAITALLEAILQEDPATALAQVDAMAEDGVIFENAVDQLIELAHQVCVAQVVPDRLQSYELEYDQIMKLSRALSPTRAQLVYQLSLMARRDFGLAPDAKMAFEMFVLRLCAFHQSSPITSPTLEHKEQSPVVEVRDKPQVKPSAAVQPVTSKKTSVRSGTFDWKHLLVSSGLSGLNKVILEQATFKEWSAPILTLDLPAEQEACVTKERQAALEKCLSEGLGAPVKLRVKLDAQKPLPKEPPSTEKKPIQPEQTQAHLEQDKDLQQLVDAFDATIEKVTKLKSEKQGE